MIQRGWLISAQRCLHRNRDDRKCRCQATGLGWVVASVSFAALISYSSVCSRAKLRSSRRPYAQPTSRSGPSPVRLQATARPRMSPSAGPTSISHPKTVRLGKTSCAKHSSGLAALLRQRAAPCPSAPARQDPRLRQWLRRRRRAGRSSGLHRRTHPRKGERRD
jgi:hypothetical protein